MKPDDTCARLENCGAMVDVVVAVIIGAIVVVVVITIAVAAVSLPLWSLLLRCGGGDTVPINPSLEPVDSLSIHSWTHQVEPFLTAAQCSTPQSNLFPVTIFVTVGSGLASGFAVQ